MEMGLLIGVIVGLIVGYLIMSIMYKKLNSSKIEDANRKADFTVQEAKLSAQNTKK